MAISVDGYGPINQSNAKDIYVAWKRGEVDLDAKQQKKCESFLTDKDYDEIQYDTKSSEKEGRDKIGDAEKADSHGGQGGNAAATSIGGAIFAAGAAALTKIAIKTSSITGWAAIGMGAATVACSSGALICANKFDNGYEDRTGAAGNASATNETMDSYTAALENSMDMMNEDAETYKEQSDLLTTTVNTQTSEMADLQMQYDSAMAAGDVQGARSIKDKMKELEGADNSALEEQLEETGGALEEYRAMNSESLGVSGAGQTVSDFLKEGTALGIVATLNSVLLAAATVFAGISIGTSIAAGIKDASHLDFGGLAASIVASALFVASVALLGSATSKMIGKSKGEFECASKGKDMQGHVDTLNDMIVQQEAYVADTEGIFEETDEASAESQEAANEAAGEATDKNAEKVNKKKEKEPAGAGAGGGDE